MRKIVSFISIFIALSAFIYGQNNEIPDDFKVTSVNKKVKEFPDVFDNSSPLSARITVSYIWIKGTVGRNHDIKPERERIFYPPDAPNEEVSETSKNNLLNSTILEILTYHDSIAGIITQYGVSNYTIEYFESSNGKWWYVGGDPFETYTDCRQQFLKYADYFISSLRRANTVATIPGDTISFINFIKKDASEPKEFLLNKLKNYKLVMYGEIHRRKVSWDFCREIINDKQFPLYVGTVFMEMASHKQSDIDKFLSNDTLDKELLLDVFREYMTYGWIDKGMFDFVLDLREINQKLPENKKIRIIAVDTPRPFSTFNSSDDMDKNANLYNRDEFMASTILNYLKTNAEERHAFFIVGTSHVCKTLRSAGRLISDSLPRSDTYTVFIHSPVTDNYRNIPLRIRHGFFDYAFSKAGNMALAFDLKNGPFGNEPFDAFYYEGNGLYRENYDGYIFLGPLDTEPQGELLLELYSDKFILEINRRLGFDNTNIAKEWNIKDSSRESVIESVLSDFPKRKWEYLPPMNN